MPSTRSRSSKPARGSAATLNRPAILRRALQSVAGQTFADLVWVIVNDGPAAPVDQVVHEARALGVEVLVIHNPPDAYDPAIFYKAECRQQQGNSGEQLALRGDLTDDDDTWDERFL